jgi:alkylated DNA nucleotide flippase Atl1
MAALPAGTDVPWHRVINAQRRSNPRSDGYSQKLQLERLAAEGVQISTDGQVAADAMWNPSAWEIRDLLESLKK